MGVASDGTEVIDVDGAAVSTHWVVFQERNDNIRKIIAWMIFS